MSKIVTSTVDGFKGKVTFCEPLTLEQVLAFETAQDLATEAEDKETSAFLTKVNERTGLKDEQGKTVRVMWSSRADKYFIPAILKCVEKWEVDNLPKELTTENFPMTPRNKTRKFIDFLVIELLTIYNGETEIPNES